MTTKTAAPKTTKKASKETPAKKAAGKKQASDGKIFDQSVCAILRWMGKNDWNVEDAHSACESLSGKQISMATVKIQIRAGKTGERGEPATITAAQAKELKAAAK